MSKENITKNIDGFFMGRAMNKALKPNDPILQDKEMDYLCDLITEQVDKKELYTASVLVDVARELKLKKRRGK